MAATQGSTHGGSREGAGRKPKTLLYAANVDAIEQTIVDVLPKVVDKIVAMAMDGNLAAAKYLVDRILGRPGRLTAPPAQDRSLGYTQADYDSDLFYHDREIELFKSDRERRSRPLEPLRFGGMTLEEFQEAASRPKETDGERFQRMIQAELARRKEAEEHERGGPGNSSSS